MFVEQDPLGIKNKEVGNKMGGFLIFVGLITLLIGIVSLIKPLQFLRITTRKTGFVVLVAGLVIIMVGALLSPVEDESVTVPAEVAEVAEAEPELEQEEVEEPIEEENSYEATLGERNALRSALNYLSLMSFSRDGLIKQL